MIAFVGLRLALEMIGGLSAPSKMPCYAWSIPAWYCKVGALLRKLKGSTCSICYALKGLYVFPMVIAAMERRFAVLSTALVDVEAAERFVAAFAEVLARRYAVTMRRMARGQAVEKDGRYFRWHDSGDLQSVRHLELIAEIALRCPDVQFWLPTREYKMVEEYLAYADFPSNLFVKLSAHMIDKAPAAAATRLGLSMSAVHGDKPAEGFESCDAYTRKGHCGDCRRCWSLINISYPMH